MTMAGNSKKLQIIYDDGTDSLTSIESDAIAKLTGQANKHASAQRSNATTHSGVVESKAQEIEGELHGIMDKSVKRLAKLTEQEREKCKEHTEALTDELKRIGELVRDSVDSIKMTLSDRLQDAEREVVSEFDKTFEQRVTILMTDNFEGTKTLRQQGNALTNALQQKLDQSVWESKGSEKQVIAQLYKNYMQKASAIETHFSQIMQRLSNEFQTQYRSVEEGSAKTKANVGAGVEKALLQIEEANSEAERDINQFFGQLIAQHETDLNSELEKVSKDIGTSSQTAAKDLKTKAQDYSNSLLTAASSAQESLKTACQEAIRNADVMHTDFLDRMEDRVKSSKNTRTELESTKMETIREICDQLAELRMAFEKNLDRLTKDAEASVAKVTSEVEKEIRTAHTRCEKKLSEDGQSAKDSIEGETNKLLDMIERHKQTALKDIAAAAGADTTK